jgi:hypothetical protein
MRPGAADTAPARPRHRDETPMSKPNKPDSTIEIPLEDAIDRFLKLEYGDKWIERISDDEMNLIQWYIVDRRPCPEGLMKRAEEAFHRREGGTSSEETASAGFGRTSAASNRKTGPGPKHQSNGMTSAAPTARTAPWGRYILCRT